jgi:hypothetical protein
MRRLKPLFAAEAQRAQSAAANLEPLPSMAMV